MPSKKSQINARVTVSELKGLHQLMIIFDANQAEIIRLGISELCKQHGIEIIDPMPKPGTYERIHDD